ncbi:hypothetical protein Mro03_81440 [Microbispora rosea subsp. rosea]|nr:hypothetical protein Mro03_81440 [Microbispora rosea subsp. rosea]
MRPARASSPVLVGELVPLYGYSTRPPTATRRVRPAPTPSRAGLPSGGAGNRPLVAARDARFPLRRPRPTRPDLDQRAGGQGQAKG